MSELAYNCFKVGVSRHRRMSRLIKYSGADEKTIQAMTNKGNNEWDFFVSYPKENGIIYRILLNSHSYNSNKPGTKLNVGAAM